MLPMTQYNVLFLKNNNSKVFDQAWPRLGVVHGEVSANNFHLWDNKLITAEKVGK